MNKDEIAGEFAVAKEKESEEERTIVELSCAPGGWKFVESANSVEHMEAKKREMKSLLQISTEEGEKVFQVPLLMIVFIVSSGRFECRTFCKQQQPLQVKVDEERAQKTWESHKKKGEKTSE